jgi:putative thioredoxin
MIEASERNFQVDVLDASREQPVLVDFWAPWCAPCRALGPALEKVEADYGGRFKLVKINSDENPELAAQFNVRGIPAVFAVVDGKVAASFVGAQPESAVRAFVDQLLPNPSEIERRKAAQLAAGGDHAGALAALRAALVLAPANDEARFDLAELLIDGGTAEGWQEAADTLAGLSRPNQNVPRAATLRTRLDSAKRAGGLPTAEALHARIAAAPGDLATRLDLANLYIAQREYAPALEQLLAIVERDRAFGDDVGRKTMLAVFEMAAGDPALVGLYRRKLAAALNR